MLILSLYLCQVSEPEKWVKAMAEAGANQYSVCRMLISITVISLSIMPWHSVYIYILIYLSGIAGTPFTTRLLGTLVLWCKQSVAQT